MKRMMLAAAALLVLTTGLAHADERFVPKGYVYAPGHTKLPPVNSPAYKIIMEADRRESEIYTSKRLRADHEDWVIYNMEREQIPPRNGWRRY